MSVVFKLSDARGDQLRAFAEANSLSIADAVGALLRQAGAANEVPGFTLTPMRASPGAKPIAFSLIFDGFSAIMLPANVLKVAEHLDECASITGTGGKRITITSGDAVVGELIVARHRRHSIVLKGIANGETVSRTLTLDLARDLANQMRRALKIG